MFFNLSLIVNMWPSPASYLHWNNHHKPQSLLPCFVFRISPHLWSASGTASIHLMCICYAPWIVSFPFSPLLDTISEAMARCALLGVRVKSSPLPVMDLSGGGLFPSSPCASCQVLRLLSATKADEAQMLDRKAWLLWQCFINIFLMPV